MIAALALAAAAWTWDGGQEAPVTVITQPIPMIEEARVENPPTPKPSPSPNPQAMRLSFLAGGGVNLGADADASITPFVHLDVEAPTAANSHAPSLEVHADFTGLPGATINLGDVASFKAIEATAGFSQPISDGVWFRVIGYAGFSTRLPGDVRPRDRAPKFAAGGLLFQNRERSAHLVLAVGGDQRLSTDGLWRATIQIDGMVTLYQPANADGTLKKQKLTLIGNAILGITNTVGVGERSDLVRVNLAVGI